MTKRRAVIAVWLTLTTAAVVVAIVGDLSQFWSMFLGWLAAASLSIGSARLIARRRIAREEIVVPRLVPGRICAVACGVVMWGPPIALAAGWLSTPGPAVLSFFLAPLALPVVLALFSDGYQGLYLDSLVFFGRLAPPEDDWLLVRDAKRAAGRQKWSEGSGDNS